MSNEEDTKKKRTLLGHDLDVLSLFVKRCAGLGAVLGFVHHFLQRC